MLFLIDLVLISGIEDRYFFNPNNLKRCKKVKDFKN